MALRGERPVLRISRGTFDWFGTDRMPAMHKPDGKQRAFALHQRVTALLEELPSSAGARTTQMAVLQRADAARAHVDVPALQKLHRQAKILVQAMHRPANCVNDAAASRTTTSPAVGGETRLARSVPSSPWRKREHAPIRYPFGEPPHGWDTRLHDTIESMPDSKCSADCLARLIALRRSRAEPRAAEADARQCHGRVRYHGADQPPDWYWPDDPA